MTYREINTDTRTAAPVRPVASTRERSSEQRDWVMGTPGPGMVLGLLSALAIAVSFFMSWREPNLRPDDVPLRFLFDSGVTSHHPSLLLVLIPLAALAAIGSVLPAGAVLRIVAGLGTLAVVALFVFQTDNIAVSGNALDLLDVGTYVAAIGGFLAFVSGFVPTGWQTRRTVEHDLDDVL